MAGMLDYLLEIKRFGLVSESTCMVRKQIY